MARQMQSMVMVVVGGWGLGFDITLFIWTGRRMSHRSVAEIRYILGRSNVSIPLH